MSRMMLSMMAAAAIALPAGAVSAEDAAANEAPAAVRFAADSDEIDATADSVIAAFAADYVASGSKQQVTAAGHGDRGEVTQYGESADNYCIGLSQRRAMNVRSALVVHGVPPGQTSVEGHGCRKPAEGDDAADNRRVELNLGETGW